VWLLLISDVIPSRAASVKPELGLVTSYYFPVPSQTKVNDADDYNVQNMDSLHVPVLGEITESLRYPDDCPSESIDGASFNKMLELKMQKMILEAEIQKYTGVSTEMGQLLQYLAAEVEQSRAIWSKVMEDLRNHLAMIENEACDYEVMVKLKQGQVEVQQAAVVTDYSDALIFHTDVIEKRNARILQVGAEKVTILNMMREFRKKINQLAWEQRMFHLSKVDIEEKTKDVHMLRVTKNMQAVLKGGDDKRQLRQAEGLERKIEHVSQQASSKVLALRQNYTSLLHQLTKRRQENSLLESKLAELQTSVERRENIRKLKADGSDSAEGGVAEKRGTRKKIIGGGGKIDSVENPLAKERFHEAKKAKHLQDKAKDQTDEIMVLRQELDRLRQKTFPSFVQTQQEKRIADQ